MESVGPVYCFSMDDGVGYYKICQAWDKKDFFGLIDQVVAENPSLKNSGKLLKSKLSSHDAREKLGTGKSVRILKLKSEGLSEDAKGIKRLAKETGVLGVEILGKSNCFTAWNELRVYGKGERAGGWTIF